MEYYIENVTDITYMSERSPCILARRGGLIRPSLCLKTSMDDSEQSEESRTDNLRSPTLRKLCAH